MGFGLHVRRRMARRNMAVVAAAMWEEGRAMHCSIPGSGRDFSLLHSI
jgi:hypothetical protein